MSKNRREWSENEYHRRIKEGRGQGTGADYIPWILIQEIPSNGFVSRIQGYTTGRMHHLFSHLEADYFTALDYNPHVKDIREQFPLPLSITMELSDRLNVAHPWPPNTDFPCPITTDFLITRDDGRLLARTTKYADDLKDKRVIEKFKIEQAYWERENVDWKIVTEKQVSKYLATNLRWLYYGAPVEKVIPGKDLMDAENAFLGLYANRAVRFCYIVDIVQERFSLPDGAAIALFKDLIRRGRIRIDLRERLDFLDSGGR